MKVYRALLNLSICMLLPWCNACAQDISSLLKGFDPRNISYYYEAYVVDNRKGVIVDRAAGKMTVYKNSYLDSNNLQINCYDGVQSLQINMFNKTAYLKRFKKFKQDDDVPNVLFDLNDMQRYIERSDAAKNKQGEMIITVYFKHYSLDELQVIVGKDLVLKKMILKMSSYEQGAESLRRVLVMDAFTDTFDKKALTLNKYFSDKTFKKMTGAYAHYDLKHIIL